MSGILRGILTTRSVVRNCTITRRANISARQAKDPVGATESIIGLTAFLIAIMAPAAWVLTNLESYKKRD